MDKSTQFMRSAKGEGMFFQQDPENIETIFCWIKVQPNSENNWNVV